MKRSLLLATALVALALSACVKKPETSLSAQSPYEVGPSTGIKPWADPKTGCEYLIYIGYSQGGITPRMGSDGKQICTVTKLPN